MAVGCVAAAHHAPSESETRFHQFQHRNEFMWSIWQASFQMRKRNRPISIHFWENAKHHVVLDDVSGWCSMFFADVSIALRMRAHFGLCNTQPHSPPAISCYSILFHVIPCYSMLFHVIPCYSMIFHVIPCYTYTNGIWQCFYNADNAVFECYSNIHQPAMGILPRWVMALELFSTSDHDLHDIVSFTVCIGCCAKGAQWLQALQLLRDAVEIRDGQLDAISYDATMNALQKAGKWQHALRLLEEMRALSMSSTLASHTSLISSFEKSAQWEWALQQFSEAGRGPVVTTWYLVDLGVLEPGAW